MDYYKEIKNFLDDTNSQVMLVEGQWGIGKTYLVDECIEEYIKNNKKVKRVDLSLFGVSDLKELNERLMNASSFGRRTIKKLKNAGIGLSYSTPFGLDISLNSDGIFQFLLKEEYKGKKYSKTVIIIDDIERKDRKISITEIFGFIDSLKAKNTKIILISNVEQLSDHEDETAFNGFKEKIINRELIIPFPTQRAKNEIIDKNINVDFSCCSNLRTIIKFNLIYNLYKKDNSDFLIWNVIFRAFDAIDNCKINLDSFIDEKINLDIRLKKMTGEYGKKYDVNEIINNIRNEYKDYDEARIFSNQIASSDVFNNVEKTSLLNVSQKIYNNLLLNDYSIISEIKFKYLTSNIEKYSNDYLNLYLKYDVKNAIKSYLSEIEEGTISARYDYMSLYQAYAYLKMTNIDIFNEIISVTKMEKLEEVLICKTAKVIVENNYDYSGDTHLIDWCFIQGEKQRSVLHELHKCLLKKMLSYIVEVFSVDIYDGFISDFEKAFLNVRNLYAHLASINDLDLSPLFKLADYLSKNVLKILSSERDMTAWEWKETRDIIAFFVENGCKDIVKKSFDNCNKKIKTNQRYGWFYKYFKLN